MDCSRYAGHKAMRLVIQRAEHRDTQAIQAKLDELLRIHGGASNELMRVDEEDAEEIEKERRHLRSASSCSRHAAQCSNVQCSTS